MAKRPKFTTEKIIFILFFNLFAIFQAGKAQVSDRNTILTADADKVEVTLPFQKCWYMQRQLSITVASDNANEFFIGSLNGTIGLFNVATSNKLWETTLGGEIKNSIYDEDKDVLFVVSQSLPEKTGASGENTGSKEKFTVRALNSTTGISHWEKVLSSSEFADEVFVHIAGANLITITKTGNIYALDMETGQIVWEYLLKSALSAKPFFDADKAVLGLSDKRIVFIDLLNDKILNELDISTVPTIITEDLSEKKLFRADQRGIVLSTTNYSQKTKTGKRIEQVNWKFRNGSEISHISLTPKGVLISSLDNFIYMLSKINGKIIWKKRFTSRVLYAPLIVGDYAFVDTYANPSASVIELSSGKTVNSINLTDENFFTDSPLKVGRNFIFPTLEGLLAFSPGGCAANGN